MKKSQYLNIVLAIIVLILVIQIVEIKINSGKKITQDNTNADTMLINTDTTSDPFRKISLGVKSEIHPKPAFVIGSYDKDGNPNMMTAAWAGICNSDPLSIAVSMRPATYSYWSVTESKAFTVNIPSADLVKYVSYAGKMSAHDVDKFKETGLTPIKGEFVNAPYIKEFPVVIECELTEFHDLGSHRMFIGKIIDVKANENVLNSDGRVDVDLLNPLIYAGRGYYQAGRKIASGKEILEQIDGQPYIPKSRNHILNEVLEVIHSRKSVRHFTNKPVSKQQLEVILRAGMAAPTAVNRQPWAFYVVTERAILDTLAEQLPYAKMLFEAQAAIIVCGDMEKAGNLVDKGYWVQDCSAATQNILLAAESIGLGAVWTAAYPYDDRTEAVIKTLNLPKKHIPLNVIPIGYPTGEDLPKNKWKPENVTWK